MPLARFAVLLSVLGAVAVPAAALSEAQVAGALNAVDRQEIDLGDFMAGATREPAVRDFAAWTIGRHAALDREVAQAASRLSLRGDDSPLAASLRREDAAELDELRKLQQPALDRAFAAREASSALAWRRALEQEVAPGASRPELRALVESARAVADERLERAQRLQQSLQNR